jgi:Caspase domain
MNDPITGKTNLYALLIGVDCYLPNQLPGGYCYASLGGCVRDINHVEEFLRRKFGMPEECILKLTATNAGRSQPLEPRDQWPTYENMVDRLKQLTTLAHPGDQVYIHYSGHGGRATTVYPDLKGTNGSDEALVPTDIGNSEARYLRDVEMAHLLKTMVDRGLIVTVVLDSCHSGGATRGLGGAVPRRATPIPGAAVISVLDFVDKTPRPTDSQVASLEALKLTWRGLPSGTTRAVKPASGWLLEPQGYTLLAACRASESAYEFPFDGRENNGALTYWLLDSLKQVGPGLSYKMLHDRILAKVHSQFSQQTPQLQGEGNRLVFGSEQVQPHYAVLVMQVDKSKEQVMVDAGQAHGMRKGTQFAIYPPDADFTQVDQRLALVEIAELGATESWAKITSKLHPDAIIQGAQAVLLDPGNIRLQRAVRVIIDQAGAKAQVEKAVREGESGFLRLAAEDERVDFQITVNDQSQYEIWDPAGKPIVNLRPAIGVTESNAAARVVQRLVHLAKYRNVQELDNRDAMSPLARKLLVELAGVQSDFDPVDQPKPKPFDDPGNTPSIKTGEWTFLRVHNNLSPGKPNDPSRILNVTVLDLQPDWGITQIYPSGAGLFEPLDPGQEILLPLRAGLPISYEEGTDFIKVFATLGTTNFRWLELPSLDQPQTRGMTARGTQGPLEELLALVAAQEPKSRDLDPAAYPSREWVTAQVEVQIKKA